MSAELYQAATLRPRRSADAMIQLIWHGSIGAAQ
jgi:hypothetical protein